MPSQSSRTFEEKEPMHWRTVVIIVISVAGLIAVDLALTRPKGGGSAAPAVKDAPVDSRRYASQVSRLLARSREIDICRRQALCPAQTMCFRSPVSGLLGCYGSTCAGPFDPSCGPEQDCNEVGGANGDPLVHRCLPAGLVQRGGRCVAARAPVSSRCVHGLSCVGGVCAAGCATAAACAAGEVCRQVGAIAACLPPGVACETNEDCPEDHSCGAAKLCLHPAMAAQGCLPDDCEAGQRCAGRVDGVLVYGHCREDCTTARACTGGAVCVPSGLSAGSVCVPRCEVQADCPAGSVCQANPGEGGHCMAGPPLDPAPGAAHEDEAAFRAAPDAVPKQADGTDQMAVPMPPPE
jgi:hypothetical protein